MTKRSTEHATIAIERTYDAAPARVFAAWADVDTRARWSVPAGDQIVFLEHDFRVGGRDVSRCGPAGDLAFLLETSYQDIVADERIVLTETVARDATRLSVSLLTVEFQPAGPRTRLILAVQMVALDGADILAGSEAGWREVLDNLARTLA